YCSQGPQILDLYVEDGFVYIKTSPVKEIILVSGIRHTRRKFAKQGEFITEAKFPLKDNLKYVRFDVVDENQKHANTRAYFSDEWE
ncbi:MAG: PHP domain-containing protein, partial [Clostridia bacterium]|nr:PHP domain-containing protein [Clostridia bacterium]